MDFVDTRIKLYGIIVSILTLLPIGVRAQVFETRARIDTLKWNERISLHTNAVDWALLIPNIGVEYDIRGNVGKDKMAHQLKIQATLIL